MLLFSTNRVSAINNNIPALLRRSLSNRSLNRLSVEFCFDPYSKTKTIFITYFLFCCFFVNNHWWRGGMAVQFSLWPHSFGSHHFGENAHFYSGLTRRDLLSTNTCLHFDLIEIAFYHGMLVDLIKLTAVSMRLDVILSICDKVTHTQAITSFR